MSIEVKWSGEKKNEGEGWEVICCATKFACLFAGGFLTNIIGVVFVGYQWGIF